MRRTDPIPPPVPRGDAVGVLRRELWIAEDAGEKVLAAQLRRRLAELGVPGTTEAPARETTAAQPPARQTNARTAKKTAAKKPARSSRHVPRQ